MFQNHDIRFWSYHLRMSLHLGHSLMLSNKDTNTLSPADVKRGNVGLWTINKQETTSGSLSAFSFLSQMLACLRVFLCSDAQRPV